MKPAVRHALAALALLLALSACTKRAKVIPEKKFARITAEMLLADQWISNNRAARRNADTTLFYGLIFDKYGYSFKDYDKSLKYYLKYPPVYAKVYERAADILEKELVTVKEETIREKAIQELEQYLHKYAPKYVDFQHDTLIGTELYVARRDSVRADTVETARELTRDKPAPREREDL